MSTNTIYPFGDGVFSVVSGISRSSIEESIAPAPQLRINKRDEELYITHPLLYPESSAELVLMVYRKRNCKKPQEYSGEQVSSSTRKTFGTKKGWCVLSGGEQPHEYFHVSCATATFRGNAMVIDLSSIIQFWNELTYKMETENGDIEYLTYDDIDMLPTYNRRFYNPWCLQKCGLAIRMDNPDWNRVSTSQKNGVYKGIPESIWSQILPIHLGYSHLRFSIGLL